MAFSWDDLLNGLDKGLDVAKTISMVIPVAKPFYVGIEAVDTIIGSIIKARTPISTPIETVKTILNGIVLAKNVEMSKPDKLTTNSKKSKDINSNVTISNKDAIEIMMIISKSRGNNIDASLIKMVKTHIKEKQTKSVKVVKVKETPIELIQD